MSSQRTEPCLLAMIALVMASMLPSMVQSQIGTHKCNDWKEGLELQNKFRAMHQAPPLVWNNLIEAAAQSWADYLVDDNKCVMEHSGPGENIYAFYGRQDTGASVDAAQYWLDEEPDYKYDKGYSGNTFHKIGHFTQVVWKSTSMVGCGCAVRNTCTIVVCQYLEWGNMQSNAAFKANVLPAVAVASGAGNEEPKPKKKSPASPPPKKKTTGRLLRAANP